MLKQNQRKLRTHMNIKAQQDTNTKDSVTAGGGLSCESQLG